MYIPEHFREKDIEKAVGFAKEYNFAALCTFNKGRILATHIPVLVERQEDEVMLLGHIAKRNLQKDNYSKEALVIFSGPHSYISSGWYEAKNSVPTWNFLAAHFYGDIEFLTDKKDNELIIKKTLKLFEGTEEPAADEKYFQGLLNSIISFRIKVKEIEFKRKLSQNKPENIRLKVISRLEASEEEDKKKIAELMKANG